MRKNIFLLAALLWTGLILFFCLENARNLPEINSVKLIDKYVHFSFHFILTTLWFLYLKKKFTNSNFLLLLLYSFLFSLFFGIVIEIMQEVFTTTRRADILDVLGNTIGGMVAVVVQILINRKNGQRDNL